MNNKDHLKKEYSEQLIRSGERGKYTSKYREGTNVVMIDPDLHPLFPDSEAVNRALRNYAKEHQIL
ncbi:MAG: hypothetical protein JXX29_14630 [Deltaproteobacteria bacterium]|nr:hypothetical protein [Deltaproteobacteria bacterium]MBN2672916.1 hypothetical protein [Deltaproteobacteria bacterium]